MKATEFRIGNLVDYAGEVMLVESILSSTQKAFLHSLDRETLIESLLKNIQPILLTEEWLLRFGFMGPAKGPDFPVYQKDRIMITNYTSYWKVALCTPSYGASYDVEMHNIHQLQNLYFALTGEELTVKP